MPGWIEMCDSFAHLSLAASALSSFMLSNQPHECLGGMLLLLLLLTLMLPLLCLQLVSVSPSKAFAHSEKILMSCHRRVVVTVGECTQLECVGTDSS
jgi:hypothetical protein